MRFDDETPMSVVNEETLRVIPNALSCSAVTVAGISPTLTSAMRRSGEYAAAVTAATAPSTSNPMPG